MKLLVYFARSGTDQDQQEDRQTEKTKKYDKEGEAGDTQEEDQAEESEQETSLPASAVLSDISPTREETKSDHRSIMFILSL